MNEQPKNILEQIIPDGELTVPEFREWIFDIENRMNESGRAVDRHTEDCGITVKHTFTPGLYVREIFMPAGSLIISRIHLFEHPFIVSKGRATVYDGAQLVDVKAPYQGVTSPGTKRILYIHEDTLWTTFHITEKKTFEEIDENGVITCDKFEEYEQIINKEVTLCLG